MTDSPYPRAYRLLILARRLEDYVNTLDDDFKLPEIALQLNEVALAIRLVRQAEEAA